MQQKTPFKPPPLPTPPRGGGGIKHNYPEVNWVSSGLSALDSQIVCHAVHAAVRNVLREGVQWVAPMREC